MSKLSDEIRRGMSGIDKLHREMWREALLAVQKELARIGYHECRCREDDLKLLPGCAHCAPKRVMRGRWREGL